MNATAKKDFKELNVKTHVHQIATARDVKRFVVARTEASVIMCQANVTAKKATTVHFVKKSAIEARTEMNVNPFVAVRTGESVMRIYRLASVHRGGKVPFVVIVVSLDFMASTALKAASALMERLVIT